MKHKLATFTIASLAATALAVVGPMTQAGASFPGANGKIAFIHRTESTGPGGGLNLSEDVWVMNADGSGRAQLSADIGALWPAWSPDGAKIAFQGVDANGTQIHVISADGTGRHVLTDDTAHSLVPRWSPDGTKISFTRGDDLWAMSADGSGETNLTPGSPGTESWHDWSPDGSKIVFALLAPDGNADLYVMNADGSARQRLTTDPAVDSTPSWSPDGTKILFASSRSLPHNVWVMSADGSNQTSVGLSGGQPKWAPDGTKITFQRHATDDNFEIYSANPDGSGLTNITNTAGDDFGADWQPLPVPDADGDGIPDDEDVEAIQDAVADLPASAFKGGDPGHARAVYNALEDVEAAVAVGDTATALDRLQALRKRVDGCGQTADRTDWIVDCAAQLQIRALIDDLIANLSN